MYVVSLKEMEFIVAITTDRGIVLYGDPVMTRKQHSNSKIPFYHPETMILHLISAVPLHTISKYENYSNCH